MINVTESSKDTVDVGIERDIYEELESIVERVGVDVEDKESAVRELANSYINMTLSELDRFKFFGREHNSGTA